MSSSRALSFEELNKSLSQVGIDFKIIFLLSNADSALYKISRGDLMFYCNGGQLKVHKIHEDNSLSASCKIYVQILLPLCFEVTEFRSGTIVIKLSPALTKKN